MAMDLPVISFEAEINRFDSNPSLMSRLLIQISDEIFRLSSLWTLGALVLAFLATFRGFSRRRKLLLFRRFRSASDPASPPSPAVLRDSDPDDVSSASSSSDGDDHEEVEVEVESDSDGSDSRVAGSRFGHADDRSRRRNRKFRLSRRRSSSDSRFSWSDFVSGKSVVKTWDGLGLGLGLGFESSSGLISLWDLNRDEEVTTASSCYNSGRTSRIPAIEGPSPAVVVSAGVDDRTSNIGLKVWDTRLGRRSPAMFAEWDPRRRKAYSGEGAGSVEVRDMRNVAAPLEGLTESDVETWWDADAVIVDGDREVCRLDRRSRGGSVVSRCRNAVLSYLL